MWQNQQMASIGLQKNEIILLILEQTQVEVSSYLGCFLANPHSKIILHIIMTHHQNHAQALAGHIR